MGEIADLTSSKRVHAQDYVDSGIPFYRGKEISELREHKPVSEVLYITEEKYKEMAKLYGSPQVGDLLITAVGTIGNTWVVDNVPFYFKDGNLIWFKNIKCNPNYLDYVLSSDDGQKKIDVSAIGSNQKALTMVKLNELKFMFPNDDEQVKIGEYFSCLDNLITLHQRKCEETRKLKKYMLQKMFPQNGKKFPEIRFKGFTEDWEQRKLGYVVEVCSGRDYKHLEEGNIPVYGTGGYMLSVSDALSYNEDAIGIGRKGTIDKPYILKAPFWTVDTLFYCVPKAKYDLNFAFDLFQNINWKAMDESTGVPSLSKTIINKVEVLSPTLPEQQKIGNYLNKLDHLITLHQQKLFLLKMYEKTFIISLYESKGEEIMPELEAVIEKN